MHTLGALDPIAQVRSSGEGIFALPFHVAGGRETDVFVTADRGATWTEILPLTGVASVQILDAKHVVALGDDGTILRWDGGEWIPSGKVATGQRMWFRAFDEGWIIDGDKIARWSPPYHSVIRCLGPSRPRSPVRRSLTSNDSYCRSRASMRPPNSMRSSTRR